MLFCYAQHTLAVNRNTNTGSTIVNAILPLHNTHSRTTSVGHQGDAVTLWPMPIWTWLLLALCLLGNAALAQEASATDQTEQAFAKLANDYWAFRLQENPLLASRMGQNEHNDKLPGVAPKDHARRLQQEQAFLRRLRAIDEEALTAPSRLNLQILEFILRHDVELAQYRGWRMPILSDSGFHSNINFMARGMRFTEIGRASCRERV